MSAARGPGCTSARSWMCSRPPLLHLLEHVGERRSELQRLLDLVARDVGILPVFEETVALVRTDELDERGRVRLPVHRKALQVLERGVDACPLKEDDRVLGVL